MDERPPAAPELMEGDDVEDDVKRLRDQTRTLAELLAGLLPGERR
ncbi:MULTISPECIES: hypothetical protein [unclassified Spirillospora]